MSNATNSIPGARAARASNAPVPPHDPIAIAALIAELPELEKAYIEAREKAEIANKALDVMQERIDRAISALKGSAPNGSRWKAVIRDGALNMQNVAHHQQQLMEMEMMKQLEHAEHMKKLSPPPPFNHNKSYT